MQYKKQATQGKSITDLANNKIESKQSMKSWKIHRWSEVSGNAG